MKTYIIRYADGQTEEIQGTSLSWHSTGAYILVHQGQGFSAIVNNGPGVSVFEKQEKKGDTGSYTGMGA